MISQEVTDSADDSNLGTREYYPVPISLDNARRDLAIKNALAESDENLEQLNQAIAQLTFVATPEVYDRASGVLTTPGVYFSIFIDSGPEGVQEALERRAALIADFIAATRTDIGLDGGIRNQLATYNEAYTFGTPEYSPNIDELLEADSEREIELDEAEIVRQVDQRRLRSAAPEN